MKVKELNKNLKNKLLDLFTYMLNKSLTFRSRNFIYLMKLYKYKLDNYSIKVLIDLEIENSHGAIIKSIIKRGKINNLSFTFSGSIFKNVNSIRRINHCFNYWIPLIVKASKIKSRTFSICIDSSDKGHPGYLNMDSEYKDKLIPDLYSMEINHKIDNNFSPLDFDQFKKIWLKKKSILYWRGSTTGKIYSNINELNSLQRIQICNNYKNTDGLDIKITKIVQNKINIRHVRDWLISKNIFSEKIDEEDFKLYKYYPDIPGNALAWGTIRKYLMGNLIFKPYTKRKLFYYQFMQPWKDYIPVTEDFTDLNEKYQWVESNIEEAAFIAWNGYFKANDYINKVPDYFISTVCKNMNIE